MQSCLEKVSMDGTTNMPYGRHQQILRSEYSTNNEYSVVHPNALADGDRRGRGTGHGGHGFWLPNCNSQLGVFNYSNFDTGLESGAGNSIDNEARNTALTRSLYTQQNQYGNVDTSLNVLEGQVIIR